MSDQPRNCHICGTPCRPAQFCPVCVAAFPNRRPAGEMSGAEREAELRLFDGPMEIPFDLIRQRIEELVGRPVWTHELGLDWEGLVREAGGRREAPTLDGIIDLIPEGKRVVMEVER